MILLRDVQDSWVAEAKKKGTEAIMRFGSRKLLKGN